MKLTSNKRVSTVGSVCLKAGCNDRLAARSRLSLTRLGFCAFVKPAIRVVAVSIEIAAVGVWVSWMQLRYLKKRDQALDIQNAWTETHRLMIGFRFKRELLNLPDISYPQTTRNAIDSMESLHVLKGHLDRMPDSERVKQIADFLHDNENAEQWRSSQFQTQFDQYARRAAILARPSR